VVSVVPATAWEGKVPFVAGPVHPARDSAIINRAAMANRFIIPSSYRPIVYRYAGFKQEGNIYRINNNNSLADPMEFSITYVCTALILVGAFINLILWRHDLTAGKAMETILFWCLVVGVGLMGITVFFGSLIVPGMPLDSSGWPAGVPFRWGSVSAWLAIGLAGLACAKWRRGFWGATILISSVVFFGDVAGRLTSDLWLYNAGAVLAGPALLYETALPIVMIALWLGLWNSRRHRDVWLTPVERKPS